MGEDNSLLPMQVRYLFTVLLIREIYEGPMCLNMSVIVCGCILCVLMLVYYGMYSSVCKSMYMWACVCMDVYWSGSCMIKWTWICTWLSSCIITVYMWAFVCLCNMLMHDCVSYLCVTHIYEYDYVHMWSCVHEHAYWLSSVWWCVQVCLSSQSFQARSP